MKRTATADRTHVRRHRGRPFGSTKGLPPRVRLRLNLDPKTVAAMERCATAAGLRIGPWVDFIVADLESKGQLLVDRKEKDLIIREARHLVDLATSLTHAKTIDDIIASAAKSVRSQGDRESEDAALL
jgi:hypothetical protein